MLQFALCYHLGVLGKGTNHMILNLGSMEDAEQQSLFFLSEIHAQIQQGGQIIVILDKPTPRLPPPAM
jgi:hypothetical protein